MEAGYVWNGQETLGNVTSYISNAPIDQTTPQYDFHATMVGSILVGLGPPNSDGSYYYYQLGMAPGAFLSSVAIATGWVGDFVEECAKFPNATNNDQVDACTQAINYFLGHGHGSFKDVAKMQESLPRSYVDKATLRAFS